MSANLSYLTITGGSGATSGGGIDNSGSMAVSNSTIVGNTALSGGGIYNNGVLTLTNSTVDDNTATSQGGGIYFASGTATIVNSTIADNAVTGVTGSTTAGGGIYVAGGTDVLNNTIVALNTSGLGNSMRADDIAGVTLSSSSSNNLIGTGGAGGLVKGVNGNLVGVANPGLGPLANNGGPTQTISLLPGSPAIAAGNMALAVDAGLTTDQRGTGYPRFVNNTVDIGAFERGPSSVGIPTVYTVTDASGSPTDTGSLPYAIAQADLNSNPAGSVINFNSTDFATEQTITLPSTLMLSPPAGPITITGPAAGVIISGNSLVGVFQVARNATANLTGLTIEDGSASSGGGILNNPSAFLTLTNDNLNNNAAVFYGGAVYNNGGTLTVTNSTFSNNSAAYGLGGAIDNSGTLTVSGSTFNYGNAFQGGAIDNKSGSLSVSKSSFAFNTAIEGGGIFNDATATIIGSTIANNSALPPATGGTAVSYVSFDGGAIANDLAGVLTLTNSTLADNAAGQSGGAIDTVGILTAVNDTIAYNTVAPGGSGGGVSAPSGTATFNNTIIAQNTIGTGTTATPNDIAGNVSLQSAFNLIGTGGGGLTTGTNGNQVGVASPGLGVLEDNGGPTETIALLKASPAIGAGSTALAVGPQGNPLTTDQRGAGYPRIVNKLVDIGAFEAGTTSVYTVDLTSDTGATTGQNAGDLLYCITLANADQNPSGTVIQFSPSVFSTPQTINLVSGPLVLTNTSTSMAINGTGANLVTINGNGTTGVLQVARGVTASLSGLTITGGAALTVGSINGDGGGIDNSGTLTLTNIALTGDSAINGGGLANETGGKVTVSNSTFSSDSGTTGGGIYNVGTMTATNVTIADNTNVVIGGGIFNAGTLTVVNGTIAYNNVNFGGSGGGIDVSAGSTVGIYNTIVAQNTSTSNSSVTSPSDIFGTVAKTSSNNLIGIGGAGGLTAGSNGNLVGVANPGLTPSPGLGNNGGQTQTIALLAGSPALGVGGASFTTPAGSIAAPTTDQRGVARPSGAISIGAYQSTLAPAVVPLKTTPSAPPTSPAPEVISTKPATAPAAVIVTHAITSPPAPAPHAVKKVVVAAKKVPSGGSASKFLQKSKPAAPKRIVAVVVKHASVVAKKKK